MSVETERLEKVAAEEREQLAVHLESLQHQIERAVDPKMIFERYPLPVLGVVMFAGVVLGAVTKGDGRRRDAQFKQQRISRDEAQTQTTWGEMRGAAVGMIASRLGDVLYNVVTRAWQSRFEADGDRLSEDVPSNRGNASGRHRSAST